MVEVLIKPLPQYDLRNEEVYRLSTRKELNRAYKKDEDIVLRSPDGAAHTLRVSNTGQITASDFASPYYWAEDATYIYYSWDRIVGDGWLAKRRKFSDSSVTEINHTGLDAQPQLLAEFQALVF